MKFHEKYKVNLDWDNFFVNSDLLFNDSPVFIPNFLLNPKEVLSWQDVEDILNTSILPFNFIDDKDKSGYTLPFYEGVNQQKYQNKSTIINNIYKGLTFQIACFNNYKPQANSIISQIDNNFDTVSTVGILGSLNQNSKSFSTHIDESPIFAIQTYGEIEWTVYDNNITELFLREKANNNFRDKNSDVHNKLGSSQTFKLTPGDLLYMPSRKYHHVNLLSPRLTLSIQPHSKKYYPSTDYRYYEIKN
jgi:hypothetical protein